MCVLLPVLHSSPLCTGADVLPQQAQKEQITTLNPAFVEDKQRSSRLRRKVDLRFLPLCAFVYLLNYLDRGNIGAARIMNKETNDDILQVTNTTAQGYAVAISVFSVAYAVFEIPSNLIMKRYVRPSLWLGILLFGWGAVTVGFTGVQTYPQIVGLRFLIGTILMGRSLSFVRQLLTNCLQVFSRPASIQESSISVGLRCPE